MYHIKKSDLDETRNQPAAKAGLNFDTLYTLNYPDLPFNVHEELTGPNTSVEEYTLRYHNGCLAPTDEAYLSFINDILTTGSGYPHWGNYESIPKEVKQYDDNDSQERQECATAPVSKRLLDHQ